MDQTQQNNAAAAVVADARGNGVLGRNGAGSESLQVVENRTGTAFISQNSSLPTGTSPNAVTPIAAAIETPVAVSTQRIDQINQSQTLPPVPPAPLSPGQSQDQTTGIMQGGRSN
jgi:hypothetical protein